MFGPIPAPVAQMFVGFCLFVAIAMFRSVFSK